MEKNGIELRDYQERIVEKAVKALEEGHSVVINAPTGTGKTLMALEVLRRLEKTGWIYVRTISQYSSWERDAKKLGLGFTGLMRKGEFCKVLKKPYILYCTLCDEEANDPEHIKEHKKFIERRYINPVCYDHDAPDRWSAYCPYRIERIARELEEDAPEFVSEVMTKMYDLLNVVGIKGTANWFRDNKVGFKGSSYDVCIYKLIEGKANIRIYSYIYFFLGIRRPEVNDDAIVVFDEAHNLDDFNINSVTITLKEILGFFSRIEGMKQEQVQEAFVRFVQDPESDFEFMNLLVQANEELARKFSIVMEAWKERDKWYIERDEAMWSYIKVMPADPAMWLSRLNNYRYILLSGTMPSGDYLRTVWGLTNFEYINAMSLWSSTSLREHFKGANIFIDDSIYYIKEERPNYRKKVVEIIRQYLTKDGLNLVIVPSYNEIEAYRSLFPGAFFEDLRPDVLDRVKRLGNGAVVFAVAGGKLSEGIEVLDSDGRSRIKSVFIVGLPLPEYKDPYLDKMIEVVSRRVGRDPKAFKWTVLYEKAIIKVKQAIGRAIRGSHDSANIYLIDKRFGYRNVMRLMNLEVA
jgi:DNA excision repair protein ERCC-2